MNMLVKILVWANMSAHCPIEPTLLYLLYFWFPWLIMGIRCINACKRHVSRRQEDIKKIFFCFGNVMSFYASPWDRLVPRCYYFDFPAGTVSLMSEQLCCCRRHTSGFGWLNQVYQIWFHCVFIPHPPHSPTTYYNKQFVYFGLEVA